MLTYYTVIKTSKKYRRILYIYTDVYIYIYIYTDVYIFENVYVYKHYYYNDCQ